MHIDLKGFVEELAVTAMTCDAWLKCIELSNRIGAKGINVGYFHNSGYWPIWVRMSTVDYPGFDEYLRSNFISHDPVLMMRENNLIPPISQVSLKNNLKAMTLSQKEIACHELLLDNGVSDFLVFRVPSFPGEKLVSLLYENRDQPLNNSMSELANFASLICAYTNPPDPENPQGKITGIYEFLSVREQDTLKYLATGLRNDEIAYKIGISEVTVRLHIRNARKKMRASTREEAVALSVARGLITI